MMHNAQLNIDEAFSNGGHDDGNNTATILKFSAKTTILFYFYLFSNFIFLVLRLVIAHPDGFKASEEFADTPWALLNDDLIRSYVRGHSHHCWHQHILSKRLPLVKFTTTHLCAITVLAQVGAPYYIGSWLNSPFSDDAIRQGSSGPRSFLNPTEFRRIVRRARQPSCCLQHLCVCVHVCYSFSS